jgi:hypothetical protein
MSGAEETNPMMDSCAKHRHEKGAALCGRCGEAWCNDCLVYAFGPKKAPLCMSCAMYAGGVRSSAPRPALPKRELKALQKAAKAEAKANAKAGQDARQQEPEKSEAAAAAEVSPPAASIASDWETPWWEDRQPALTD